MRRCPNVHQLHIYIAVAHKLIQKKGAVLRIVILLVLSDPYTTPKPNQDPPQTVA
jgi:hypothetical protein